MIQHLSKVDLIKRKLALSRKRENFIHQLPSSENFKFLELKRDLTWQINYRTLIHEYGYDHHRHLPGLNIRKRIDQSLDLLVEEDLSTVAYTRSAPNYLSLPNKESFDEFIDLYSSILSERKKLDQTINISDFSANPPFLRNTSIGLGIGIISDVLIYTYTNISGLLIYLGIPLATAICGYAISCRKRSKLEERTKIEDSLTHLNYILDSTYALKLKSGRTALEKALEFPHKKENVYN